MPVYEGLWEVDIEGDGEKLGDGLVERDRDGFRGLFSLFLDVNNMLECIKMICCLPNQRH